AYQVGGGRSGAARGRASVFGIKDMRDLEPALEYDAHQSVITDPGVEKTFFHWLPEEMRERCMIVQGVIMHPFEAHCYEVRLRQARLHELELRYVALMLRSMWQFRGYDTLHHPFLPEHRLLGNCRDYATLLCAILQHYEVPARVRCGCASYFVPGFFTDH